mgnify:CR=1 FL=1
MHKHVQVAELSRANWEVLNSLERIASKLLKLVAKKPVETAPRRVHSPDRALRKSVLHSAAGAEAAGAEAAGAAGAVTAEEQFLCKLKGVAHVHAQWLTAAQIASDGRLSAQRLQNFERKRAAGAQLEPYASYMEVDRVIAASGTKPPTQVPTKARPAAAASDDEDEAEARGAARV